MQHAVHVLAAGSTQQQPLARAHPTARDPSLPPGASLWGGAPAHEGLLQPSACLAAGTQANIDSPMLIAKAHTKASNVPRQTRGKRLARASANRRLMHETLVRLFCAVTAPLAQLRPEEGIRCARYVVHQRALTYSASAANCTDQPQVSTPDACRAPNTLPGRA